VEDVVIEEPPWTLVIACSESFAVRVLYYSPYEALSFARWMRASGWRVQLEPTRARNPYALGRTREEEDLALGLVLAHDRWARQALGK
jgi:hypothetical protein